MHKLCNTFMYIPAKVKELLTKTLPDPTHP